MSSRSWMKSISLLVPLFLAVGCQNALHDENVRLYQQNVELQERLSEVEAELARRPDAGQVQQLQSAVAERDAMIADLRNQLSNPARGGIPGVETEFNAATGEVTVRLPGDVLFDSGSATLKASSRRTLDNIAAALNRDYTGKRIRVEGHTDSDPVVKTRSTWQDNRNLSLARALAVTRYLESKGVAPSRIATTGYGEHRPRGNSKEQNRRVEIVVLTR